MNDDIERRLRQVKPRGAPPELRRRVLSAVADQLNPPAAASSRQQLRPGFAIAASVLISLVMNYWVNNTLDRHLAILLGPLPVDRQAAEIATDIASLTDTSTGHWAYKQLVVHRPKGFDPREYAKRLQQMIQQVTIDLKETTDEAPRTNPQMDRDLRGSRDHDPLGIQRLLRLEYRNTA